MDRRKLAQAEALVGGRFKLTALLQKRVRELVRGAPRLVSLDTRNFMEIALQEVLEQKIELSPGEEGKAEEAGSGSEDTEENLAAPSRGT